MKAKKCSRLVAVGVDSDVSSDDISERFVLHVVREGLGVVGTLRTPYNASKYSHTRVSHD